MAYEKQTWTTGEVITEEKLNHIEDGLAEAGQTSYFDIHSDDQYATKIFDWASGEEVSVSDVLTMLDAGKPLSFTAFGSRRSISVDAYTSSGTRYLRVICVGNISNDEFGLDIWTFPVSTGTGALTTKVIALLNP